jgi:hypothetical protein
MNVALFSGTNDYLADPTDVQLIRQQLPKGSLVADVVQNGYAHMVRQSRWFVCCLRGCR